MATQPSTNPVQDSAAEVIIRTMYTDAGVIQATPEDAAQALQDAGLLTDHTPEPDVATLHMDVTDAGETWRTGCRFTHASPSELADMLAAGVSQVIQDAVELVGRDQDATPVDQAHLALDMLHRVTRDVVPHTLDGLPNATRAAVMLIVTAAGEDDQDDTQDAGESDD